jgi:hypothetical protein
MDDPVASASAIRLPVPMTATRGGCPVIGIGRFPIFQFIRDQAK